MEQYIYVVRPSRLEMLTKSTSEEDEIVGRHFEYLKNLTDQGVMILVGRTLNTDENTFGIAIFETQDEPTARQIMDNDPAVKTGIMKATLYPYRIALMRA